MPLSKYNKEFGGKKGAAAKAKRAMVAEYGATKGKQVFYAMKNKRKSTSKMPKGAMMSPSGDLGEYRQMEAVKAGGFKDGAVVKCSTAMPSRECHYAKGTH